ncbi:head protein [Enterococcus faecalis]|uniref:head protein n=1 Tax=Enterococcus faecalis TaxID=1351 RepID=UPI002DBA152C|nr:head protein [Enterococcus faecalis]MEB7497377.1 head protein [Enterococcus faecalis]
MTKKKTTASERYWEKRRELEDKARLKLEKKTLSELESVFERALVKIQRQLLSQADLHDITQSEMLEDFSKRDQEKYRKYIEKNYGKLMESDEAYKQFIDEYFPSYDYVKVNRLLQLRADIFSTLADEAIASDVNGKFNNDLENITKRIYNSNSNALMQLLGGSAPGLSKKELENITNYPWSGKTFSSRLWGNISSLEQRLSNSIINSLASGEGVLEALRTMKNDGVISGMFKLEQGKFNRSIENLVRTEYSHFAVEGIRESFRGANVKESESWSAEDERVCSVCGGRHGKKIEDDLHPPYHTLCRCTEIPRIQEIGDDIDALYEKMFGDLLDEFAKDQFGVKLNRIIHTDTAIEMKNPVYNTERPRKKDFESYEELQEARIKYREDKEKREKWLDVEAKRFYDERIKSVKDKKTIIKNIEKLGLSTENLASLDPVALDSVERGVKAVFDKYPELLQHLKANGGFSLKALKARDSSELMAYNGSRVEINTEKYATELGMRKVIREFIDDKTEIKGNNFHALSDEFSHVITHEFGHVFEDYLISKYGYVQLWTDIANSFDAREAGDLPFVSQYSYTNKSEWFAEIFGQSIVGQKNSAVAQFDRLLEKIMREV